jgi:hypothetical protein
MGRGIMLENDTYMLKANLSTSAVSRAVWPVETHRRPITTQELQDQQTTRQRRDATFFATERMPKYTIHIHFFYTSMIVVLCVSMVTTWMFFLHQWLLLSLIVLSSIMLVVLMLNSLFFSMRGQEKESKQDAATKTTFASFLPAASPITPMPPSIGKSASLQAYYTQRYAPRTPMPEAPLVRVLETVNLKEE